MTRHLISWCLLAAAFVLPMLAGAAAEMTADQIIDKSYDNNMMDFDSATATLKMDYYEGKKLVNTRKFRVKALSETQGEVKLRRLLLTVTDPADESGTAFLSIEQPGDADDDQWLYLSALKKAFRKGGKTGKSESFMGSEFTYGDLESKDVDQATHKRLPDEARGGMNFYVIESTPKNPQEQQYSKYVTYIDKATFIPRIIMFYDLKGKLLKTMTAEKVEKIDGDDTITRAVMVNKQNGNSTRIYLTDIDTKVKLDPADFTKSRMTKM